jgi:hypothetical protein
MRSFIAACIAVIVVAVAAVYVLDAYQEPADVAYASRTGVRL